MKMIAKFIKKSNANHVRNKQIQINIVFMNNISVKRQKQFVKFAIKK